MRRCGSVECRLRRAVGGHGEAAQAAVWFDRQAVVSLHPRRRGNVCEHARISVFPQSKSIPGAVSSADAHQHSSLTVGGRAGGLGGVRQAGEGVALHGLIIGFLCTHLSLYEPLYLGDGGRVLFRPGILCASDATAVAVSHCCGPGGCVTPGSLVNLSTNELEALYQPWY